MNRTRLSILAAVAALSLSLLATASASAVTITVSGSTSVAPLATKLAKAFVKKNPGTKFRILQGGSDIGIADVARGRVTIGTSSRDPRADPGGLVFNKIARDGVCVATNPDNALPDLSQDQVQDIFSGQVRRWSDVEGPRSPGRSTSSSAPPPPVRRTRSGTSSWARTSTSRRAPSRRRPTASCRRRRERPERDRLRVFNFTRGLYDVPYQGVACNLRNAKSGQYPGVRNFWFVTRGQATGVAKKFIKFARSAAAVKIVAKDWVPLK